MTPIELTPNDKKRIEEEERKRLAEEQYRAQLRARLSEHSTQPTSSEPAEPTRNRTGWPKARLLLPSFLALLIGALWFAASHYIVFAKNGAAILRKENFQLFPLTLDVSHWTISDVMQNPDMVLLFVQQRKAYLLPGGAIIQAVTDTVSAGGSPALSLAKQFREGEHGQVLIRDLLQKRAASFANPSSSGLKARAYLNEGIRAYKNANYPEAVASFQKAVERDPTFKTTHLYLATAT